MLEKRKLYGSLASAWIMTIIINAAFMEIYSINRDFCCSVAVAAVRQGT